MSEKILGSCSNCKWTGGINNNKCNLGFTCYNKAHFELRPDVKEIEKLEEVEEMVGLKIGEVATQNNDNAKSETLTDTRMLDLIDGHKLSFNLGSAIKYILESKSKDAEYIKKALYFLNREVVRLKNENT